MSLKHSPVFPACPNTLINIINSQILWLLQPTYYQSAWAKNSLPSYWQANYLHYYFVSDSKHPSIYTGESISSSCKPLAGNFPGKKKKKKKNQLSFFLTSLWEGMKATMPRESSSWYFSASLPWLQTFMGTRGVIGVFHWDVSGFGKGNPFLPSGWIQAGCSLFLHGPLPPRLQFLVNRRATSRWAEGPGVFLKLCCFYFFCLSFCSVMTAEVIPAFVNKLSVSPVFS